MRLHSFPFQSQLFRFHETFLFRYPAYKRKLKKIPSCCTYFSNNARVDIPLLVISCPINQERRASNGDFDYTNEMDVFCYVRAEVRQNGATIRFDATREEKKTI